MTQTATATPPSRSRPSAKGRIIITKERKRIAEYAERTGNTAFTVRDARSIMQLTTLSNARKSVDALLTLRWADKVERPKYARSKYPDDQWYRLTRAGVEKILGKDRAIAMFDTGTWSAIKPQADIAIQALPRSGDEIAIGVSTGTLRIALADVRKVYGTLHALVGRRSEG